MENREAIEWFKKRRDSSPMAGARKMFDMAIAALEFRERYDNFWEEVKAAGMKGEETEIRHSGRVFRIREVAQ